MLHCYIGPLSERLCELAWALRPRFLEAAVTPSRLLLEPPGLGLVTRVHLRPFHCRMRVLTLMPLTGDGVPAARFVAVGAGRAAPQESSGRRIRTRSCSHIRRRA